MEIKSILYGIHPNVIDVSSRKDDILLFNESSLIIFNKINLNDMFCDPCPHVKKYVYIDILLNSTLYKYEINEYGGTLKKYSKLIM